MNSQAKNTTTTTKIKHCSSKPQECLVLKEVCFFLSKILGKLSRYTAFYFLKTWFGQLLLLDIVGFFVPEETKSLWVPSRHII